MPDGFVLTPSDAHSLSLSAQVIRSPDLRCRTGFRGQGVVVVAPSQVVGHGLLVVLAPDHLASEIALGTFEGWGQIYPGRLALGHQSVAA